ncbi:MAG TPA: prolyl oligopeptidase family serine peptidase [Pirellulaceae bacterium]|nr:prolyl oligopeptidase family serine peptidase [Pirellulaceae bacterium]
MKTLYTLAVILALAMPALAQPLGEPDRGAPGDEMIQKYLAQETAKIEAKYADDVKSLESWQARRAQYVEEYHYMLGLSPRPEKTPLAATITGTLKGDGYEVDMIHYQSRPRLYVTGNLYRPAQPMASGGRKPPDIPDRDQDQGADAPRSPKRYPAVFYVCGHSGRGRNGNKVAYQSHGIWFARHGYICLVVDTLQLGEIAAKHHGTYNLERWWWHSRGYTPAGVEAWNGVRGIDYLVSRPDVDPERIAVTGISGGGAATFWVAAADERVKVAVPVSGMADLESYVPNRVINGHCDCMFFYNTFQWPWTRIANLVAPRPMLFVNSDNDRIFPMDANDRIHNRLERMYSLYGKSDEVDAVVSVGGHAYRQDIRQAAYRFINAHLRGDARPIDDSEIDIVSEGGNPGPYPIAPEKLRVFPEDSDLPKDELNTTIDERFVPLAAVAPPEQGKFEEWKKPLLAELKRVSFGYFPDEIPAAKKVRDVEKQVEQLQSEESIEFRIRYPDLRTGDGAEGVFLAVLNEDEAGTTPDWVKDIGPGYRVVVLCEPRGIGATKWTRKNGPNYVERSHALLGRTIDAGRVWDVIAAAKYLASPTRSVSDGRQSASGGRQSASEGREPPDAPALKQDQGADAPRSPVGKPQVFVAGKGPAGLIAAYAAALEDSIAGVTVIDPPASHMDAAAPQLLNVLRVCDVPDALGLIAPRPLTIVGGDAGSFSKTTAAYEAAGTKERLSFK